MTRYEARRQGEHSWGVWDISRQSFVALLDTRSPEEAEAAAIRLNTAYRQSLEDRIRWIQSRRRA